MRLTRPKADPRTALLRELRPLRQLGDRDLNVFAATFDEADVPAGAVLTRQGRCGDHCYLIVDGHADVSIDGEVVASVGPGEFVGEMALITGAPRSATVTAVTPMHLFTVHKSAFAALLDHAPVARTLLSHIADRLRRAEGAPDTFAFPDMTTPRRKN
jgi:CRP-like cAMP-binding protein